MAKTGFTTSSAETKKLWEEQLFRDAVKQSYFSRFMGSNADSVMQVKTDLERSRGDRVRFSLVNRLSGAGVGEGQTLEGNEESLNSSTWDLTLTQRRHAVRDDGAMSRQRAVFSISEESRFALRNWQTEKIDEYSFTALEDSPTKIFYGGSATSTATLTASDKITPALISKLKAWAVTGGARSQTPLRPVMVDGKRHYILLVHPDVGYDLKQDSDWQTAQQNGNVRGMNNPIFSGALGVWDNVIVHEHENVGLETTWGSGSNVAGAKCSFLGAQALCWAWGSRPEIVTESFDYQEELAYATKMIYAVGKPQFDFNGSTVDYGSIAMYVARTDVSGS